MSNGTSIPISSIELTNQEPPKSTIELTPQEKKERLIREVLDHASCGNLEPFIENIMSGKLEVDQMDSRGYTAMHLAVWKQDFQSVIKLLDKVSCPVDIQSGSGQTPLMLAAIKGNLRIVKLLLDRGADIENKDSLGITPLLCSVQSGQLGIFYTLLSRGAQIDAKDRNGCGAAHWAAYKNQTAVLRVLKQMGIELSSTDCSKMTPLHRAAMSNATDSIEYLLFIGQSAEILDSKNRTPLDVARENNSEGASRVLKSFFPNGGPIYNYFSYLFILYWIGIYSVYYTSILPETFHHLFPSLMFNLGFMWIFPLFM